MALATAMTRAIATAMVMVAVGTLGDGYIRNAPLPRAPQIKSTSHVTCHGAVMRDGSTPLHSTPWVNSTPCHSTHVQADPWKQKLVMCHVMEPSHVTDQLHSTPLHSTPWVHSTPLHSTRVQADPRIRQASYNAPTPSPQAPSNCSIG